MARRRQEGEIAAFEPRAVLFDFDGVIVDSEPLHWRAFHEVLAGEGIELSEAEYLRELIGFDDLGAFRRVFELRGRRLDGGTLGRIAGTKAGVMRRILSSGEYSARPGVGELVRALGRRYPLAICSGALRGEIEEMLEGVGLRGWFAVITSAEDVAVGKPDPAGYLRTAELVGGFGPGECLVIEDAPAVIARAAGVGFWTLGVVGSYPAAALSEADAVVERLGVAEVGAAFGGIRFGE